MKSAAVTCCGSQSWAYWLSLSKMALKHHLITVEKTVKQGNLSDHFELCIIIITEWGSISEYSLPCVLAYIVLFPGNGTHSTVCGCNISAGFEFLNGGDICVRTNGMSYNCGKILCCFLCKFLSDYPALCSMGGILSLLSFFIHSFSFSLPERDYVTFGSLLSQFRLSSVCL